MSVDDQITIEWIESFWWRDDIGRRLYEKCGLHVAWNANGESGVAMGSLHLTCINTRWRFAKLVRQLLGVEIEPESAMPESEWSTAYLSQNSSSRVVL